MDKKSLKSIVNDFAPKSRKKIALKIVNLYAKFEAGVNFAPDDYKVYITKHSDETLKKEEGNTLNRDIGEALRGLLVVCDEATLKVFHKAVSFNGFTFSSSGTTTNSRNRLKYYQLCKAVSTPKYKDNIAALETDPAELRKKATANSDEYETLFSDLPHYVDSSRTMNTVDKSITKIDKQALAWYTDQAMLMEAYSKAESDPELQQRLALVLLSSYAKASYKYDASNDNRAVYENPIFAKIDKSITYYRESTTNPLLNRATNQFKNKVGFSGSMHVIHNQSFTEVMRRTFPFYDLKLQVASVGEFTALCTALVTKIFAADPKIPTKPIGIDITKWVADPIMADDYPDRQTDILNNLYQVYSSIPDINPAPLVADPAAPDQAAETPALVTQVEFLGANDTKFKVLNKIFEKLEIYLQNEIVTAYGQTQLSDKKIPAFCSALHAIFAFACVSYRHEKPPLDDTDALARALNNANPGIDTHPATACPMKQKEEGIYNKVKPYLNFVTLDPMPLKPMEIQCICLPPFFDKPIVIARNADPAIVNTHIANTDAHNMFKYKHHYETQKIGAEPKNKLISKMINHAIANTGYRLDPSQAKELWMLNSSLDDILSTNDVKKVKFASPTPVPKVCASFTEFLAQPIVKEFKGLASLSPPEITEIDPDLPPAGISHELVQGPLETDQAFQKRVSDHLRLNRPPAPVKAKVVGHQYPYLNVYPEALVALLEGLKTYKYKPKDRVIELQVYINETDGKHPFTGTGNIEFGPDSVCEDGMYSTRECKNEDKISTPISADELREGFNFFVKLKPEPSAEHDATSAQAPSNAANDSAAEDSSNDTYDLQLTLSLSDTDKQTEDVEDNGTTITYTNVAIDEFELDKNRQLLLKGSDIDLAFGSQGLKDLLQTIYYRLLEAMRTAVLQREQIVEFLQQVELIHQETTALLTILEPYKKEDFGKAILNAMTSGTIDDYPANKHKADAVISSALISKKASGEPMIHLRGSAMHCLSSIMGAMEQQKGIFNTNPYTQVDHGLRVCALEHSYYEKSAASANWPHYRFTQFMSDSLSLEINFDDSEGKIVTLADSERGAYDTRKIVILNPDVMPVEPCENDEVLKVKNKSQKLFCVSDNGEVHQAVESSINPDYFPIDIFICDFHHNIAAKDLPCYRPENLASHVTLLHKNGFLADKFVIAIDNTINFIAAPDIKDFTNDAYISELINSGKMSLVIFRSGQKFEQLGLDNLYGGYSITINKNAAWSAFNARMNLPEDEVQGFNRQGHTHLATHACKWQDMYRYQIMNNHTLLRKSLPARGTLLTPTIDPYGVFLDVRAHPNMARSNAQIQKVAKVFAKAHGLDLSERPSFGFPTTNIVDIFPEANWRMTLGLCRRETISKWVDFFKGLHYLAEGNTSVTFMMSPSTPSSDLYPGYINKLYADLPDELKTDQARSVLKIKLLEDEKNRENMLELSFPPQNNDLALPAEDISAVLKDEVIAQIAYMNGLTCSVRKLSDDKRKLYITPGFEQGETPVAKQNWTPDTATAQWISVFTKLENHLMGEVLEQTPNPPQNYYTSLHDALLSFKF